MKNPREPSPAQAALPHSFAIGLMENIELFFDSYHRALNHQFESFAIASDNADATDPLELYWTVDDADAAHRELTNRGAVCSPVASQPFGKVFTTKDPDDRERFIVALAATRPSKAV